jgi:hypothetical protein
MRLSNIRPLFSAIGGTLLSHDTFTRGELGKHHGGPLFALCALIEKWQCISALISIYNWFYGFNFFCEDFVTQPMGAATQVTEVADHGLLWKNMVGWSGIDCSLT